MKTIHAALVALTMFGGLASAHAQANPPPAPPRSRIIIIEPPLTSGPSQPPERQYVPAPPSLAPPMERVPQVAPLSPRPAPDPPPNPRILR